MKQLKIIKTIKTIFKVLRTRFFEIFKKKQDDFHRTYSQCGEDRILLSIFNTLGISKPTYIDVGANHPTNLSNTYLFYLNGSTGINIEPDPELIDSFNKCRPNDVNINVGIGIGSVVEDLLDFYVMSNRVLNTFSKEEAERVSSYGSYSIESIKKIKVIPLQKIIESYFSLGKMPDFISIDVEGLDYQILETLDLKNYTQTIFCVETINYTEDNSEKKNEAIFKYFADSDFFVYADTYLNTIFMNKNYWQNREKHN